MISVTVNQEQTEARLSITPDPENEDTITADQLVAVLKKNNVVAGISKKNLFALRDRFNHDPTRAVASLIARGLPKKPGVQHSYKFHFTTDSHIGKLKGSSQIDYKNKGTIKFFRPEEVLLAITLGQDGTPGRLVDGSVVKNEPLKPLRRYKAGSGVTLDENSTQLIYSTS